MRLGVGVAALVAALCSQPGIGALPASAAAPSASAAAKAKQPAKRPAAPHRPIRHQPRLAAAGGRLRQGAAAANAAAPLGAAWTSLGPQPVSGLSTYGNSAGRITAMAANGSTVYAGAADGGVWKSTDSGAHWAALTDNQATLAIGSLAVTGWGTTSETIYAGTGEANLCEDCLPSQGVLVSTNGGASWALDGQSTFTSDTFFIGGLAIDRTATSRIFAATNNGVYESIDSGANWSFVASGPGRADDIVQDPGDSSKFWVSNATDCVRSPSAGTIGYLSTAGANISWNPMWPIHGVSLGAAIRIGLGVGTSNTVYAAIAACSDAHLLELLKSTDAGVSWNRLNPPDFFSSAPAAPIEYQGWYDNVVGVDPSNPNHAVFGGITLDVTSDGGSSFTDVANPYNNGPLHPDFHAIAFTGTGTLLTGNDGGVWSTANFGQSWTNRNATLSITQFYSGSAVDLTHLAGGSQDNGTTGNPQGSPPAAWTSLLDGDGFMTAMFRGQSALIGENSGLDMWQFDYSGTGTPTEVAPCPFGSNDPSCTDPTGFVAPFVVDPASTDAAHARVYAGTNVVYRTTTGGLPAGGTTSSGAWVKVSGDLTENGHLTLPRPDWINTMSVGAGTTSATVMTGSWYGKVFITTSGPTATASSWTDITANLPTWSQSGSSGNAWITGVAVNPLDSTEAWVAIGTLTGNRIFHTHNATAPSPTMWSDISTGLPASLVVDSILVDPKVPQNVYVGTDAGAMVCTTCADNGGTPASGGWVPLGTGLPNVRVDALTFTADDAEIVGWTHGRGAWYVPVPLGRPGAELSPSSLSFGDQPITTTSAPQDLMLSNNGSAPLMIASITPGYSSSGDFKRVANGNDCGALLVQGSSCLISIVFAPTTTGTRSGTATVTDNAVDSPQTAALNGNGVPPPGGKYNPIRPTRIIDTRTGPYPVGQSSPAPLGPGGTMTVLVADGSLVPADATAVVMNVTVTQTTADGYLTIYPAGQLLPLASSLNWNAGQTVPNLVEVQVGTGGRVNAFNGKGDAHVVIDVEGWVSPQSATTVNDGFFTALVPYRITDTRSAPLPIGQSAPGQVPAGQTITVQVAGTTAPAGGVPPTGAEAVILNVTVTRPQGDGYLTVYPKGQSLPLASNLNYVGLQTVPNRVIVPLGSNGQISIYVGNAPTDVVVDVNGYFTSATATATYSGRFTAVPPARLIDTRVGPYPAGQSSAAPVGPGQTVYVQVAGQGGVPALTAPFPPKGVALNVTVARPSTSSYLIVYPSGATQPLASDLNWPPLKIVPNMVVVKLGADGRIAIYNGYGTVDVVVDVLGWYS